MTSGPDHESVKLLVSLITFWTLLAIFSNVFADYLGPYKLINNYDPACYRQDKGVLTPEQMVTCNLATPDTQNNLASFFNDFIGSVLNVQSHIPILNLLVPLEKILLVSYASNVPTWLSLFLDSLLIYTVFLVYVTLIAPIP